MGTKRGDGRANLGFNRRGELFEDSPSADSSGPAAILLSGCTVDAKNALSSALKSRFVWYNYGTFSRQITVRNALLSK